VADRQLKVTVLGDTKNIDRALGRTESKLKRFNREVAGGTALGGRGGLLSAGSAATAGSVALGLGFAAKKALDFTNMASDLNEQIGKTQIVFGQASKAVIDFGKESAKQFGIAETDALGMASTFGALFRPMGLGTREAEKQSVMLTKLGADLASFYNTDVADALDALQSGVTGMIRPLRRYGVDLNAARVATVAMANSGKTTTSSLTTQEKVMARLQIITQDTALAQGDFARTSGRLANQQRILKAQVADLETKLGEGLIPVVTGVVTELNIATTAALNLAGALKSVGDVKLPGFPHLSGFAKNVAKNVARDLPFGAAAGDLGTIVGALADAGRKAKNVGPATGVSPFGTAVGALTKGLTPPMFTSEGPQFYGRAYKHNRPFATKGPYQTKLSSAQEKSFRLWVRKNHVPFDVGASKVDYDMRGYWLAMIAGTVPPWAGGGTHFPDTFKTPYDTTFSAESKYATKNNPFVWKGNNLVDQRTGTHVFGAPTRTPGKPPSGPFGGAKPIGKILGLSYKLQNEELDARMSGTRGALKSVLAKEAKFLSDALVDSFGLKPAEKIALKQALLGVTSEIKSINAQAAKDAAAKGMTAAIPFRDYQLALAEGTKGRKDDEKVLRVVVAALRERLGKAKTLSAKTEIKQAINQYQDQLAGLLDADAQVLKDRAALLKKQAAKFKRQAEDIKNAVLDALGTKETKIDNARALADAKAAMRVARRIGGPEGIKLAGRDLVDAQLAIQRQRIEETKFAVTGGKGGPTLAAGGITINIHGITDPDKVAQRVLAEINRRGRHTSPQSRGRTPGHG
jgi:hypothetical protein